MLSQFTKKRVLVGLCSWNNPKLLNLCISNLIQFIDRKIDTIAIVLNDSDHESRDICSKNNIPFVSLPENNGVLAIDFLKPFIEQHEFFMNMNDDMFFAEPFLDKIVREINTKKYCSVSPILLECLPSIYPFLQDSSLKDPYTNLSLFLQNFANNKYTLDDEILCGYNHPITVSSELFLKIDCYSNNWDNDFIVGYGMDDFFAYKLWKFTGLKPAVIKNTICYHGVSLTMKRLPDSIRSNGGYLAFYNKTGMSIDSFKKQLKIYEKI